MHVEFHRYRAVHLDLLELPPGAVRLEFELAQSLEDPELAWSAVVDDRYVGCGGIARETPFRGQGWVIAGAKVPLRAWPTITHKAGQVLVRAHELGLHRIGAHVDLRFGRGLVWARRLGFEPDGIARAFLPDRGDAVAYSKVA